VSPFVYDAGVRSERSAPRSPNRRNGGAQALRLASAGVQLWTHFDIMDNVLAQVAGARRPVHLPHNVICTRIIIECVPGRAARALTPHTAHHNKRVIREQGGGS
jgi:hypothetical protein